MSTAALTYVKHLRQAPNGELISPTEKAILCQLADDHNEDRGCAWPSVGNLAHRVGLQMRQCRRVLRALESKGVIEANPRLRENGGRSSSEYRFCQIDPEFDAKAVAVTMKRMQLQANLRASLPQQQRLYPPVADDRGARSHSTVGHGHSLPGDSVLRDRGARSSATGQELLLKPLTHPETDLPPEPKSTTPTPPSGADVPPIDRERFDSLKLKLKSELYAISRGLARAKGFGVIQPSPGAQPHSTENDFDVCFRDWWLFEVRRSTTEIELVTFAEDHDATAQAMKKYAKRLAHHAQEFYGDGRNRPITISLLQQIQVPKHPGT